MPTRTRVRAKKTDDQEEFFDPNAAAPVTKTERAISAGGERVDPEQEEQFEEQFDEDGVVIEHEREIPDGDDDGNLPQEPLEEEDDPSDTNQLGKTTAGMTQGQQAAAAELRDYMRRLSNLAEEKAAVQTDIKELKSEIKGKGYDMKAFDVVFKLLEMDDSGKQKLLEQKAINHTYATALGVDEDLV